MNKERLEHLIEVLERVQAERGYFDMEDWFTDECGTASCALGYACADPTFRSAGLTIDKKYGSPAFGDDVGFSAGQSFFGITDEAAYYIFYPGSTYLPTKCITPSDVITHIRDVIDNDGWAPGEEA